MSDVRTEVRKHYAAIATRSSGGCCGTSSCGPAENAALVDYSDVEGVVDGANLGLGCGIPTRHAGLKPGETVLDLGSGAGIDVFLAARSVGPEGRVVGVDMTPEMIALARDNAAKGGYRNVDFRLGEIETLPVADGTVDVVLSNCVINLSPDKRRVFAQIHRVLKPGGRFSISDVVTRGKVPEALRGDAELWAGCIAGAMDCEEYLALIREVGFVDVKVHASVDHDRPGGENYSLVSITVEGSKV